MQDSNTFDWKADIRRSYSGILSDKQIEASIRYWEEFIDKTEKEAGLSAYDDGFTSGYERGLKDGEQRGIQRCIDIVKELDTEKAHTYASENADIYRAYDNGQERMKQIILSSLQDNNKDHEKGDTN